jgi:iron complex outermembrane receptor protein
MVNIQCALWYHHGQNMIDWIMNTSKGDEAVWRSVNHTTINSIGFELSTEAHWTRVSAMLSYSYIHQDKKQEENIVSQYALEYLRHKLVGNLRLTLTHHLNLNIVARWQDRVGSYTDFDGHVQNYQPYFLTDARLTWGKKQWKTYIEANNLFDVSYHDYGLVEQPGRWLVGGIVFGL